MQPVYKSGDGLPLLVPLFRERGAKALEERLGMKKAATEGEDVETAATLSTPNTFVIPTTAASSS